MALAHHDAAECHEWCGCKADFLCTQQQGDGDVTLTFAERAEDRAFPTALASCFAKYLRDLMVECLNQWFQQRVPDLKPTAGYYVDGHRFLDDVAAQIDELALPRHRLVRVR